MALPSDSIPAQFIDSEPEWWPEFREELDAGVLVLIEDADAPEDHHARWEIRSDGAAEWAMRQLAELTQKARAISIQAEDWRRPINQWEAAERKRVDPGIEFFTHHLEAYATKRRAETGEPTLRLPSGDVPTRRASQPTVIVVDDEALIRFLYETVRSEDYDAAVKIEKKVRLTEFRRLVETEPIDLPFCEECAVALILIGEDAESGESVWRHEDEPLEEYDHPARPTPGHRVVLASGEFSGPADDDEPAVEVPGVQVVPAETTATVKVSR